jgi:hypothetical protein
MYSTSGSSPNGTAAHQNLGVLRQSRRLLELNDHVHRVLRIDPSNSRDSLRSAAEPMPVPVNPMRAAVMT